MFLTPVSVRNFVVGDAAAPVVVWLRLAALLCVVHTLGRRLLPFNSHHAMCMLRTEGRALSLIAVNFSYHLVSYAICGALFAVA